MPWPQTLPVPRATRLGLGVSRSSSQQLGRTIRTQLGLLLLSYFWAMIKKAARILYNYTKLENPPKKGYQTSVILGCNPK